MVNREVLHIECFDIGTTDTKFGTVHVTPEGQIVIGQEFWRANETSTLMIAGKNVRSWWGETLSANTAQLNVGYRKIDGYGGTGLSGSGLMVVEKESGKPLLALYDKPTLMTNTEDPVVRLRLEKAGIPVNADPFYTWSKADAVRENWEEIAQRIGTDLPFKEIGIEPMVSTIARMFAGIPFGEQVGFGPDDIKGITGDPMAELSRVAFALSAMRYDPSQYLAVPGRYFDKYKTYLSGDFPEVLTHIKAAMESRIISPDTILVETDSNFKIYTQSEAQLKSLKRYNPMGFAYGLNRNGAGVNNTIRTFVLPKVVGEQDWYLRASEVAMETYEALENNENPFIYLPASTENDLGAFYKIDGNGVPQLIPFEEMPNSLENTSMMIGAFYAGVVAELRYKLDLVKAETGRNKVALHGGFIKIPEQRSKRLMMAGMLGQHYSVQLLNMPDPSTLVGISAASQMRELKINYDELMHHEELEAAPSLEAYYQKWLGYRDLLM
jgi:hypothetical protein